MKRCVCVGLLAVFLTIFAGGVLAQEAKSVDGTVWKQLDANNKALFTLGYFTGIQIFSKYAPGSCSSCTGECMDEASAKLVPVGTSIPQVVQMIDSIYADPANSVIPVQWSLKLAASKAKGMSDEEFKKAVEEARTGSAPAATPPPPAEKPKPPSK